MKHILVSQIMHHPVMMTRASPKDENLTLHVVLGFHLWEKPSHLLNYSYLQ